MLVPTLNLKKAVERQEKKYETANCVGVSNIFIDEYLHAVIDDTRSCR
jgi:hypothetical protein